MRAKKAKRKLDINRQIEESNTYSNYSLMIINYYIIITSKNKNIKRLSFIDDKLSIIILIDNIN